MVRLLRGDLRNIAVLAPPAGQVAARAAEGQALGTRHETVQGFLLDRVDGDGAGGSIGKSVKFPVPAFPAAAKAPPPFPDQAVMGTEKALGTFFRRSVESGLRHSSDSFTTSVR